MLVAQKVWYISKGNCTRKKSLMVYYDISKVAQKIISIICEGETVQYDGVSFLPDLEITPKQYKWFEDVKYGKVKQYS